jgi:hypothetical protein
MPRFPIAFRAAANKPAGLFSCCLAETRLVCGSRSPLRPYDSLLRPDDIDPPGANACSPRLALRARRAIANRGSRLGYDRQKMSGAIAPTTPASYRPTAGPAFSPLRALSTGATIALRTNACSFFMWISSGNRLLVGEVRSNRFITATSLRDQFRTGGRIAADGGTPDECSPYPWRDSLSVR